MAEYLLDGSVIPILDGKSANSFALEIEDGQRETIDIYKTDM